MFFLKTDLVCKFFSGWLDRMLCLFSIWKVGSEWVTSTNHKKTQLWGSLWSVHVHQAEPLAFIYHTHQASSWSPKFVNSICVYANTIRKLCRRSISSQREQGDQPLVIYTDEPPLIAQNVISDYIIFELLQLSLMSTIHQRWALLNGVWLPHAKSS